MPTQKQIDANRENAKRSTGPKTPGGKYNSCQNAITHGLFAKSILLPGEFADRFNGLMAAYINHFNPTPTNSNSSKPWPPIAGARAAWSLQTASLTKEQEAQAATRGPSASVDPPVKTVIAHRNLTNAPRSLESLSRQEVPRAPPTASGPLVPPAYRILRKRRKR